MSDFPRSKVRNISVLGPHGVGKTTLLEALLYISGTTKNIGDVNRGSSNLDYLEEEKQRKMSTNSHISFLKHDDHLINLIDTPGYSNFLFDAELAIQVSDGAIIVVDGDEDSKDQIDRYWSMASSAEIPRIIFMNKMDKETSNFENALTRLEEHLNIKTVPITIPLGQGTDFNGVINLFKMKAFIYKGENVFDEMEIPEDMLETANNYKDKVLETIAEQDDEILEKYLNGEDIDHDTIVDMYKKGVKESTIYPVLIGSSNKLLGLYSLLMELAELMPSPLDTDKIKALDIEGNSLTIRPSNDSAPALYVFKTICDPFAGKFSIARVLSGTIKPDHTLVNSKDNTKVKLNNIFRLIGKQEFPIKEASTGDIVALNKLKDVNTTDTLSDINRPVIIKPLNIPQPVLSFAIEPHSRSDEDKLNISLAKIIEEDPTIDFHRDEETNEFLLSGSGQTHIEVIVDKLKNNYGVNLDLRTPKVPYKESIKLSSEAEGKYVKQTGGRGQYGVAKLRIQPIKNGDSCQFENKIVGGVIPKNFILSVEKGVQDALKKGILAGYPVINVKTTVFDGKHHPVDSSDIAFQIAASMGFRKAMETAKPFLLEPLMKMNIIIPDNSMGDVIGDINSKRGRVSGVDSSPSGHCINALIPMAEVLTYAPELRSLTSGEGSFTMEFSHYEEVPAHISQKIIEELNSKLDNAETG
jgi:elongation factor G